MIKKSVYLLILFIDLFIIISCKKDDFRWNLKKIPEVGYLSVSSNNITECKLSGQCKSTGFDEKVEMGFCWSINPNPTIEDNLLPVENKKEGNFQVSVPWVNLPVYHVRAYVKNELTTVYSNERTIVWPGNGTLPQIQTISVEQISFFSFKVNCNLISTGGNPLIEKGIYLYSNPSVGTPVLVQTIVSSTSANSFSVQLQGLTDGEKDR
jgi:hypothetical protein